MRHAPLRRPVSPLGALGLIAPWLAIGLGLGCLCAWIVMTLKEFGQ